MVQTEFRELRELDNLANKGIGSVLDTAQTLQIDAHFPVMTVTLNRPKVANAMSLKMVEKLMSVMKLVELEQYRVLVLQGGGHNFCAGGDIKDMQTAVGDEVALVRLNRAFGLMIETANKLPAVVICLLQGAVLGGGFGLACISDVAIADGSATFALPETSLGLIPAQIAPFVVQRVGLTAARRLALLGIRIKSEEALRLGVIHQLATDHDDLVLQAKKSVDLALKCAPKANRTTKALLHDVSEQPLEQLLDIAAVDFAFSVANEGSEGAAAFMQKRAAKWIR
ncbi:MULTISPECIES: enoyl-CoA hydratase/isomerase family protein [unclassified Shewanella]|uniref:enoyl-CoA hydratase/isomerase family protein n=1 Tax=unclassified Shewanella TaxID=196818 RepID=UPI0022BA2889|nr:MULTISPECIES: enoyl-CoA hydratase-related protein [unclassified Shewanella]